jgi:glycosyltransferase involved in cell wall biosynthesis
MKILVLTNKMPYPARDGGSIATLNMLKGLSQSGNSVHCLALNTSKHPFPVDQIPAGISDRIGFFSVDCDTSVKPHKALWNLLFSRQPYIAERFDIPGFRQKLQSLLEEYSYDLVQMEGPYLGFSLELVRKASKASVSLRAHNLEHMIWERKARGERNPLLKRYFSNMASRLKKLELRLTSKCDILVSISETDRDQFLSLGISIPSITIPAGLPMEDYPTSELPPERDLFFIGALDWLPNQEGLRWFLQQVFPGILAEEPRTRLHVAGRNAPATFSRLLQHPNISYHGEVSDARQFMQSHRIMIAPLHTGSGIRVKILEAMALGRPVVTTSVGIEGIPAQKGKDLIIEDDPQLFANQVVTIIRDEAAARSMVHSARELIQENFDTFELSDRLHRFYTEKV